jgi:hypothetical protein
MNKRTRNGFLWMTIPVICLAGAALWQQNLVSNNKNSMPAELQPLQLFVEKVEKQRLTPYEVGLGYDTKVSVAYGFENVAHLKKRIFGVEFLGQPILRVGGKALGEASAVKVKRFGYGREWSTDSFFYWSGEKPLQIDYLISLAGVGASADPIHLMDKAKIDGDVIKYQVSEIKPPLQLMDRPSAAFNSVRINGPVSPISVEVRRPGEVTEVPDVSRECPLTLKAIGAVKIYDHDRPRVGGLENTTYVNVKLMRAGTFKDRWKGQPKWKADSHIVDEKGREYRVFKTGKSRVRGIERVQDRAPIEGLQQFELPIENIPASAGRLTFKTKISVNDSWPLDAEVVVRERTTVKVKSARADMDGPVGRVMVTLAYTGNKPLRWVKVDQYGNRTLYYDFHEFSGPFPTKFYIREPGVAYLYSHWSEHVEDRLGKNDWNSTKAEDASCNESTKECKLTYSVDVSHIPTSLGPLTFKADVGIDGEQFVPVSAIIRR